MSRFFILLSLCLLLVPLISFATEEPSIPRASLQECLALGEMTYALAVLRDAGLPLHETLARHRGTRPAQPLSIVKTEQLMAEIVYRFPTWTPEQIHNKVVTECLAKALGQ